MSSIGDGLNIALIVFYVVILCAYLLEGNWVKVLYWTGAILILTSVVLMQ